jgi:nicotinate-nucleotide adenylyltransferase
MRIGLFGGTFDPPHVGHLITAVNVRHSLQLDRILLEVANVPWQKEGQRELSPPEDRYALVAAAVGGVDGLCASRLEIDRGGPSYTADTLAELAVQYAGAELFTVLGWDAAVALPTWERHEEVVAHSTLVVVDRPGASEPLPDGVPWIRVEVPHVDVSSTELRARARDGRPLDYLIPDDVLHEIRARGLYGVAA